MSMTAEDAAIAKAMIQRGDKQHDIAAFFGVNSGRIAEIAKGKKFTEVAPATGRTIPTGADVATKFSYYFARQALEEAKLAIDSALQFLSDAHYQKEYSIKERTVKSKSSK